MAVAQPTDSLVQAILAGRRELEQLSVQFRWQQNTVRDGGGFLHLAQYDSGLQLRTKFELIIGYEGPILFPIQRRQVEAARDDVAGLPENARQRSLYAIKYAAD